MAQGYGDDKLEALGGHIGFADSVTVEQLAAAGVPYRTVFHLRRKLDSRAAAAEVRDSSGVFGKCEELRDEGVLSVYVAVRLMMHRVTCVRMCGCRCHDVLSHSTGS